MTVYDDQPDDAREGARGALETAPPAQGHVYEVFARKSRGEPLRHIGNVNAPDDALASSYAYNTYDEERWFDMWVVPRERFIEVFNAERPVEA